MTKSIIQDYVLSVAVSHDGQWVVSGSKDRGVQFWDSRSAIVQFMLQGHKNSGIRFLGPLLLDWLTDWRKLVISIDLSPSASLLATGSGDWAARICAYRIDKLPCGPANTLN
jgi:glucose repression regulatory protein TUP1